MYASSLRGLRGLGQPGWLPSNIPSYEEALAIGAANPNLRPGEFLQIYPTAESYYASVAASLGLTASGTPTALTSGALINAGQFGTDVGAIGANLGPEGGSWIQRQDGTIEDLEGRVLDRVPGSLTRIEAEAAELVRREEAAALAQPIPEGFYLDPAVQMEWERLNEGGGDGGNGGGSAAAGGPLAASMGAIAPLALAGLALFLIAFPSRRSR